MDPGDKAVAVKAMGRGRGRGITSSRTKLAQRPPEAREKDVKQLIKELQASNIKATAEFITGPNVTNERCQELLQETVEEVCDNVLKNVEFVEVGVSLLKYLWDTDHRQNVSIRKPLLSRVQTIYRARSNLSDMEFQGFATLLCDLLSCLTINNEPLAALNRPVYEILHELINRGNSDDSILTFHMLLCKHGALLEKQEKIKMSELMDKVRELAISEEKSKVQKCIFLEIIEQHASSWNLPENVIEYYSNTLAELMSSI